MATNLDLTPWREAPRGGEDTMLNLKQSSDKVRATDFDGALASLGILTLLSSAVFMRKLRPE
ncbi:MAG: hypothetical protein EXS38_08140 [Opitutus sp.]|nr:hypothetical protein [Opitutus sp.]